jgi:SAM-dependent methyltransferase
MNTDFTLFVSPQNKSPLKKTNDLLEDAQGNTFPIIDGIPRFVPQDNYSKSFGMQWNLFRQTQLDSYTNTTITKDRFFGMTRWKAEDLKGKKVLEVGSGAGRFTEVILQTGADLYSVEYSEAVTANFKNNGHYPNLTLCQASVYELPFLPETFDKIFCFGVLQHTPEVKKTVMSMIPYLKKGGEIAIDVYPYNWKTVFYTKYWVRPFTKRMNKDKLLKLVNFVIPKWFPISSALLHVPLIGKFLAQVIPICNYSRRFPQLSKKHLVEWAVLDTFDMLSPDFDSPQSIETTEAWLKEANLEILFCEKGDNGYVAVGRKQ